MTWTRFDRRTFLGGAAALAAWALAMTCRALAIYTDLKE
jgi:hypothetical protein